MTFQGFERSIARRLRRMNGHQFETLCQKVLTELGFVNLRRQSSGTQFGHDITADFKARSRLETWVFECKLSRAKIPLKEISNKLYWARTLHHASAFVILSNSDLANDALQALVVNSHPHPVLQWTGPVFIRLLSACPQVLFKWFPGAIPPIGSISPARFLSEERSRLPNTTPLSKLVRRTDTFAKAIKIRNIAPGERSFRLVLLDSKNRRIADVKVRRGGLARVRIDKKFKGKKVMVAYDFWPYAFVDGPQIAYERLLLDGRPVVLPSLRLLRVFGQAGRQARGVKGH